MLPIIIYKHFTYYILKIKAVFGNHRQKLTISQLKAVHKSDAQKSRMLSEII